MLIKYTIDIAADEPIMMIDSHIGFDEDAGMGIDGNEFAKELLYLDSLGKKRIEVRINSVGGSVMDGMSIYNAILKSKTNVDTHNVGIAASIAGVIFQAGRNRIMADYSLLMMHNPSGGDKKSLDKVKESLITMLCRRVNKSEDEISKMMDKTSWLTSSECMSLNLCDSIEVSSSINKPRMSSSSVNDAYLSAKAFINSLKSDKINMKQLTNKLNVAENATESEMVAAIDSIVNASKSEVEAAKKEAEEAKAKAEASETAYNELKAKLDAMEAENIAKEEAEKEKNAKSLVDGAVKAGKIANKEEAITKWVNLAKSDFDGTKEMIDALVVNKVGKSINIVDAHTVDLSHSVALDMQRIKEKYNK